MANVAVTRPGSGHLRHQRCTLGVDPPHSDRGLLAGAIAAEPADEWATAVAWHRSSASAIRRAAVMSHPIHIEESMTIARSPELVWSAVADYSNDTTWRTGLAHMTPDPPGPPAVGTKVHEALTTGGRSYVADSVVTHVGPMTYRFDGSGTLGKLAGSRTVVTGASPSEAVFTYQIAITPSGMNRLLRPIIARTARRGLRRDLQRLRDLLERG
jgi:hypothetical protein